MIDNLYFKKKNTNFPLLICLFSFVIIFLFSCKSVPAVYDISEMQTLPLDKGASAYIIANAKQARPIIDLLPIEELQEKQTAQMLDRTDSFVAALFPASSGRRFQLAALGNYPSFGAGLSFTFSRQWKKRNAENGESYWYSRDFGLSIAMDSKEAYVVSSLTGSPLEPVTSGQGADIPDGFGEFSRGSPLSLWLASPISAVSSALGNLGIPVNIPVQQLYINLYPLENGFCEAIMRMCFENATHARGTAAILDLASIFISPDFVFAPIFFANIPVQNDNTLDIKTAVLSEIELQMLFSLFFNL